MKQGYNMVLLQKKSFLEGLDALGTNWIFVGMHGTMPEVEPQESLLELVKQGVCMFESISGIRNDNHLKFTNVGNIIPYIGTSALPTELGYLHTTFNLNGPFENGQDYIKFLEGDKIQNVDSGGSIEYKLADPLLVRTLQLDSSIVVRDVLIEIEVEGVWETVAELNQNTYLENYEVNKTITGYRISNNTASMKSFRNCLSVYAENAPIGANPETVEWCLMIPKDTDLRNSVVPFGWIDCSGPNDGGSCILNTANPNSGEDVRLLYLTLQPAVLEF